MVSGCFRGAARDDAATKEFFRQSALERQRTFRERSIDQQMELFYYGNQVRHPPAMYLADCFALNGAAGVERLRSELMRPLGDAYVRDIAMLLSTIDAERTYDVAGDTELMAILRTRVARMQAWRDVTIGLVAAIGERRRKHARAQSECR